MADVRLPASKPAEQAILGAMLLNNDLITEASAIIEPSDWFWDSHRRIFQAMERIAARGRPIDLVTLSSELESTNELIRAGGATGIASLVDGVPRTDSLKPYIEIIKRRAAARRLLALSNHIMNRIDEHEDDIEGILEDARELLEPVRQFDRSAAHALTGAYRLGAFLDSLFVRPEEILHGLHRGEVGELQAVTNYGKSTLLYNTALSVAAGQECFPLAPFPLSRRVLYLDFETPSGGLQDDLRKMLDFIEDVPGTRDRLDLIVDGMVGDEPLCLSRREHFERLVSRAVEHKSDLVIVDTAASAFELVDENSNAEVTRKIMKPLKQLAIEANCAVVFTHHIGKSSETQAGEAAYRGRGASAFGALSRTVWNLEKDITKGPGYVKVTCAKIKGNPFEPSLLRLDFQTRWFSVCRELPAPEKRALTIQDVSEFIAGMLRPVGTKEIIEAFKDHSEKTIKRRIEEAQRIGLIENTSRGKYKSGQFGSSGQSIRNDPLTRTDEETTSNGHKSNGNGRLIDLSDEELYK